MDPNHFYELGRRGAEGSWMYAEEFIREEYGDKAAEEYRMGWNSVLFKPEAWDSTVPLPFSEV